MYHKASKYRERINMPTIKNKYYREFLDGGFIQYLEADTLNKIMENIDTKHRKEGRALCIAHYITGARPSEILQLKAQTNVYSKGQYIYIVIDKPTKNGLPRRIPIYMKGRGQTTRYAKELLEYSNSLFPNMDMFPSFIGNYERELETKKGPKMYREWGYKVRYYFYKWSKPVLEGGLNIYFLRHNRFSSLMENGADLEEIRILKGSKSLAGVMPYSHLSQKKLQKLGRMIK